MSHAVRKFNTWVVTLTCVVVSVPALAVHKEPTQTGAPGVPPLTAAALADPFSPANPFNTGADPVSMPGDARMAVFPYSRDQIYRLVTAPLKLTTIELAPGEKLVSEPGLGDSIQWIIDTDGANLVFVKPTKPGLVNTMHLSTNLRQYDFTLVSSPLGGLFYQSVRFRYPQSLMAKVRARQDTDGGAVGGSGVDDGPGANGDPGPGECRGAEVAPGKLNFNYTVSGSAPFKPETVFDDGRFVWIMLPKGAPYPVAVVKDHGDIVSPDSNKCHQYLVIQQLADEIVLTGPHDEVTITRGHRGLFGF
ncbi:TrbG/VirB9 family P-type conjugative transfer protein [Paraburkholderia phenazinium]|uniref:TrbG/VirB9 family P-type conjugative transfer protein n=1 Tax=Paraburkholderia phenazinium TaxID=60549 RepID=UPI00158A18A9|nr:TrbG/VirB9 family P-type conjugative transfer protein [Paraburkholderia phenazinium]